jgi:gluconolactonase
MLTPPPLVSRWSCIAMCLLVGCAGGSEPRREDPPPKDAAAHMVARDPAVRPEFGDAQTLIPADASSDEPGPTVGDARGAMVDVSSGDGQASGDAAGDARAGGGEPAVPGANPFVNGGFASAGVTSRVPLLIGLSWNATTHEVVYAVSNSNQLFKVKVGGQPEPITIPAGGVHGVTHDKQNRLVIAQPGGGKVSRREADGTWSTLTSGYQGQQTRPVDMALRDDGTIYYIERGPSAPTDVGVPSALYRVKPGGEVEKIAWPAERELRSIALSMDGRKLYVALRANPAGIWAFSVSAEGALDAGTLFAGVSKGANALCVDTLGNVYGGGHYYVEAFSPAGKLLGKVNVVVNGERVGQNVRACTFGGADGRTLFATTDNLLLSVPVKVTGQP